MTGHGLEKFAENIQKTGFFLEFKVTSLLQKHSWSVINNRYYVDDVTNSIREIDIVAYKVWELEKCQIYTTLIISCKKSEENVWAFLTKDANPADPNVHQYPIHNWTNSPSLDFLISKKNLSDTIKAKLSSETTLNPIFEVSKQIFAFQEMKKQSQKPDNDKAIYDSVTTLVKAHAFETATVGKRKSEECIYNFNLISVADTEFVQLHFSDAGIHPSSIEEIKYLNRHIVFQKDDFYRIHFISFKKFENVLMLYDKLAEWNKVFYSTQIKDFYSTIFSEWEKRHLFIKEFSEKLKWRIEYILKSSFNFKGSVSITDISKPKGKDFIEIEIWEIDEEMKKKINEDSGIITETIIYLKEFFRYDGKFRYIDAELPF